MSEIAEDREKELERIKLIASSNDFWTLGSGDHLNMIDFLIDELESEKKHSELGWEQSAKWLEENGKLRAELDQVKKENADWNRTYDRLLLEANS